MPFLHKNIRLAGAQYTDQQWYFLTLCCAQRRSVFSAPQQADWLVESLRQEAALAGFSVYAYCVMPDHAHVLTFGLDTTSDLLRFVKRLKQRTGYEFRKRFHRELWQKKFHDHILRQNELVPSIAAYIWMNPVRKKLCRDASEYLHSGSFVLDWKKAPQPAKSWAPPTKRSSD
ncbi:MAG TPA: transposase [Candidatus Acidoferrales bacterium]|nr:transposase [Candidatus Acidoferrales bacterium]